MLPAVRRSAMAARLWRQRLSRLCDGCRRLQVDPGKDRPRTVQHDRNEPYFREAPSVIYRAMRGNCEAQEPTTLTTSVAARPVSGLSRRVPALAAKLKHLTRPRRDESHSSSAVDFP